MREICTKAVLSSPSISVSEESLHSNIDSDQLFLAQYGGINATGQYSVRFFLGID